MEEIDIRLHYLQHRTHLYFTYRWVWALDPFLFTLHVLKIKPRQDVRSAVSEESCDGLI